MTADLAASSTIQVIEAELAEYAHGRVPRELRRRQVVALAEELFIERGYQAASMDELARRAGVSKPVVYDMVGSKEELYGACMSRAADALALAVATAVMEAEDDDASRLRAGSLAWFRFIATRRPLWDALLSSGEAPVTEAIEAIRVRQDGFVALQLSETAHAEGRVVDDEIVGAIATTMNGAYEALGRWWEQHPDYSAEQLADLYTALVLPGLTTLLNWVD